MLPIQPPLPTSHTSLPLDSDHNNSQVEEGLHSHEATSIGGAKVSVLIAAYKQELYLSETLESLIAQTYSNWEAIIVDDCSPDAVATIARKWVERDKRIHFFHTEENMGVSHARNYAASKASGKYVMSLDGDDIILPGYIQLCVGALEKDSDVKVAYTNWQFFGASRSTSYLGYEGYEEELLNNQIHVSALLRLEDYRRIGGFDEDMHTALEDWDFWIRILNGASPQEVVFIPERLFLYRQKKVARSATCHARNASFRACQHYIYNKHRDTYLRIFGEQLRPEMLLTIDRKLFSRIDSIARLHEISDGTRRLIEGLDNADFFARLWGYDQILILSVLEMIVAGISDLEDCARETLGRAKFKSYCLLVHSPDDYLACIRRKQMYKPRLLASRLYHLFLRILRKE